MIDTNKESVTKYAKHKLNSPTKWKAWKYKLRPPDTTPCERVLVCLVANCWTGHRHLFEEEFFSFSSTSFSFSRSTTTNLPAEVCQREAWSHGPCENITIIIEISNHWCSCSSQVSIFISYYCSQIPFSTWSSIIISPVFLVKTKVYWFVAIWLQIFLRKFFHLPSEFSATQE